ncbi:MAG: DUF4093 domain-containing protein [Clostridia bacterium]|nr:DUF4093 domain-containing protein [Clostridia bacterium]
MLHIKETIVVEGKFDREILKKVTDAPIICTGGFSLYTNKNIINSIRKMAERTGVIVLTDSDSAGFRIRNYIKQCVGERGVVKHAYIPSVEGKERRKDRPGKEGLLGVEGMTEELLSQILKSVTEVKEYGIKDEPEITKTMLFEDGLSGGEGSSEKRRKLVKALGLPLRMSANAMLDILNSAIGYEEYKKALGEIENKSRS